MRFPLLNASHHSTTTPGGRISRSGPPTLFGLQRSTVQCSTFLQTFLLPGGGTASGHTAHTMEVFDEEGHDRVCHTRKRGCPSASGGGADRNSPVFGSHSRLRGNLGGGCRPWMVEPRHQRNATGSVHDGSLQCRP